MKKEIVVQVFMKDAKYEKKALNICIDISGHVESASLFGPKKDQVMVVGEGVDVEELLKQLRKHVGPTVLVSANDVEPPKPVESLFGLIRRSIIGTINPSLPNQAPKVPNRAPKVPSRVPKGPNRAH